MILTFKGDIAKRKKFFTPESFAHPAKFSVGMLLWIIGKYTKPGDTILDPMFGSGSTMLAARYGRNVIGVELEQKFVDLAKGNWGKVVSLPKTKFGLGSCQIVQGDARNLEGLLVDRIVTSPPFGDTNHPTNYLGEQKGESGFEYSDDPSNIGNLNYGKIDSIITSPPYEATFNEKQHTLSGIAKRDPSMRTEVGGYSGKVDAVISSPPYEGSLQGDVEDKISSGFNSPQAIKMIQSQARGYSKEANNIGNLRRDTYLEAMLQVYQACYNVLKPNRLMVLVTKDFIRKGQRILLSIDTIALCEQAGFAYEDWHERKLTQQSFWRTLYQKKHPEVEKLETEDILVFRKPSGEGIVDAVVTSPPYAETFSVHAGGNMRLTELNKRTVDLTADERREAKELAIYSGGEDNISNLPYGSIDTIVSSPPYVAQTSTSKQTEKLFKGRQLFKEGRDPQQHSKGQIGDLPYDGAKVNEEWIKSRQGRK